MCTGACVGLALAFTAVADPFLRSALAVEQGTGDSSHVEEERYTRFSSSAAEYEFEYPAGWQVRDRLNEAEPEVGFIGPSLGAKTLGVALRVCRSEKARASSLLDRVLEEMVDLAKRGEARVLEIRTIEIDGNRSRVVKLARVWRTPLNLCELMNPRDLSERPVVERYLLIERGGQFYSVCYVAPEDHDARFSDVFEQVTRTFHFRSPQP